MPLRRDRGAAPGRPALSRLSLEIEELVETDEELVFAEASHSTEQLLEELPPAEPSQEGANHGSDRAAEDA
jgi:hypothetical protein